MQTGEIVKVVLEVRLDKDGNERVYVVGAYSANVVALPPPTGTRNVVSVFADRAMNLSAFNLGPPPKKD